MTGDDWLSDRERTRQARAETARKAAALACAKQLRKATDALHAFVIACTECKDASAPTRDDDGRLLLMHDMREYAGWLEGRYER